jgi:superfamily I DNA/RNA helicase
MEASRVERGTPLDRKKRVQVWRVFEEFQTILRDKELRDVDTAFYECRKIIESRLPDFMYQSVIVDEGQDLSMNAYRLLRVLAGPEHQNDLFIVGDTHQRIYKNKPILSKCGVNIRGRSSYLRINYRTTEETRKFAFSLLKDIPFDDLDEAYDDGKICCSLTHGAKPIVRNFSDVLEECGFIATEIRRLLEEGIAPKSICVVARTHKLLDGYIERLTKAGLKTYEIKQSKLDDSSYDGIRIATMHRVKGLEFQYIFVTAVNKKIVPLAGAIITTDPIAESESITAEKCLLYVAITRARHVAYITSYGAQSEFLEP